MKLPEEDQVVALRDVAELGARRIAALNEAEQLLAPLREASVRAARAGAGRNRIKELAHVGPNTLYRWLADAGVAIRPKRRDEKADDQDPSP
jgi:hypothetical protein